MGRRRAREVALQILYQVDLTGAPPEEACSFLPEVTFVEEKDLAFARELVFGTLAHREALDRVIAGLSHDWPLYRMAAVDRNIMRLALYEIFHREDIPNSVAVNEAVELAKTFGGHDSSRFVNGILGQVVKDPGRFLAAFEGEGK